MTHGLFDYLATSVRHSDFLRTKVDVGLEQQPAAWLAHGTPPSLLYNTADQKKGS